MKERERRAREKNSITKHRWILHMTSFISLNIFFPSCFLSLVHLICRSLHRINLVFSIGTKNSKTILIHVKGKCYACNREVLGLFDYLWLENISCLIVPKNECTLWIEVRRSVTHILLKIKKKSRTIWFYSFSFFYVWSGKRNKIQSCTIWWLQCISRLMCI